jgi:hypothetical protein
MNEHIVLPSRRHFLNRVAVGAVELLRFTTREFLPSNWSKRKRRQRALSIPTKCRSTRITTCWSLTIRSHLL